MYKQPIAGGIYEMCDSSLRLCPVFIKSPTTKYYFHVHFSCWLNSAIGGFLRVTS